MKKNVEKLEKNTGKQGKNMGKKLQCRPLRTETD
jgi:hypothetical protein